MAKLSLLFNADYLRKIYRFVGGKVVFLFLMGIVTSFVLFFLEYAMAYGLEAFMKVLGFAKHAPSKMDVLLPAFSLKWVLLFIMIVVLLRGVFQWLQSYLTGATLDWFKFRQRSLLLSWVFTSRSASSHEVSTLFGERCGHSALAISQLQSTLTMATLSLFIFSALYYLSPGLTIMSCSLMVVLGPILHFTSKKIGERGSKNVLDWNRTNSRLMMSIKNLLLLRIYDMQGKEEDEAQTTLYAYLRGSLLHHLISGFMLVFPQVVGVGIILLIALNSRATFSQNPSALFIYLYLFLRLLQNISLCSRTLSTTYFYWPQLKYLARWWNQQTGQSVPKPLGQRSQRKEVSHLRNPIGWTLRNLNFSYSHSGKPVFDNLNLDINPGSTLAVIGPSGAGKSTLLNLILGQISPDSGEIIVNLDGTNSPIEREKSKLLKNTGYVGSESFIVEGSIYDNLTYGLTEKPKEEEIQSALSLAECSFVHNLTDGMGYRLSEQGVGLSAGQKQRLALARALLRRPRALILDEATNNLDSQTEDNLIETFSHLKGKLTIVAVTHKPAILKIADQTLDITDAKKMVR